MVPISRQAVWPVPACGLHTCSPLARAHALPPHGDTHVKQSVVLLHLKYEPSWFSPVAHPAQALPSAALTIFLADSPPIFSDHIMSNRHLPRLYYTLSQVGKAELDSLVIGPSQHSEGLTRAGFLFAQMESTSTLPASTYAVSHLLLRHSCAEWRRNLARASVMVAATQCTKAVYNKRKCNTTSGTQYSGLLTPGQKASTEQLYDITNNRMVTMSIIIGA